MLLERETFGESFLVKVVEGSFGDAVLKRVGIDGSDTLHR